MYHADPSRRLGTRSVRAFPGPVVVSVIPRQRDVAGLPRRRTHVNAIKLDPGMSRVVTSVALQSDHQDGGEPLFGEQPVMDECVDEAARCVAADREDSHDDLAQSSR